MFYASKDWVKMGKFSQSVCFKKKKKNRYDENIHFLENVQQLDCRSTVWNISIEQKHYQFKIYFKKIVWQCHCSNFVITVFKRYWIMS